MVGSLVIWVMALYKRYGSPYGRRRPVGYVLGYRRTDGTTWTRTRPEGSSFLEHCDWAEETSQRSDVAEAWVSLRQDGEMTRYRWVGGREVEP